MQAEAWPSSTIVTASKIAHRQEGQKMSQPVTGRIKGQTKAEQGPCAVSH